MILLDILKANKGTVSSALGKELAEKVLKGDYPDLSCFFHCADARRQNMQV